MRLTQIVMGTSRYYDSSNRFPDAVTESISLSESRVTTTNPKPPTLCRSAQEAAFEMSFFRRETRCVVSTVVHSLCPITYAIIYSAPYAA